MLLPKVYILVLQIFCTFTLSRPNRSRQVQQKDVSYTICVGNAESCRADAAFDGRGQQEQAEDEDLNEAKYDPDVIQITQGYLRGKIMLSRNSRKYYSFMRIPYVQPPIRFESAEPPLSWKGIRDATKKSALCPQVAPGSPGIVVGDEDCLYLTVHAPEPILRRGVKGPLVPVLVFIHGGCFSFGGGDQFGAKYFMDQEVILVTFNYRLGALGFFTTGDGEILGNMGLKDSVMALQWVQNNIRFFGGNPAMVTLMGESSGASSASLMLLSPSARGLFSRVILQSGTALSPWALPQNPVETARKFASKLGCNGTNTAELAACMRNKDVLSLVLAKEEMSEWNGDPICITTPTVEVPFKFTRERLPSDMIFLPEHPYKMLFEGKFHRVPVMMGVNKDEGLILHAQGISESPKLLQEINADWNRIAPITLQFSNLALPSVQSDLASQKIRKYYLGDRPITPEEVYSLSKLYGDRFYTHGVHTVMAQLAKHVPVFPYHFSFQGSHSAITMFGLQNIMGVTHMDELLYLFELGFVENIEPGRETEFSEKLIKLWTSFVYNGQPVSSVMSTTATQPWLPVSRSDALTGEIKVLYDLNQDSKPIKSPFIGRMRFWNRLLQHELREETRFVQYRQKQ